MGAVESHQKGGEESEEGRGGGDEGVGRGYRMGWLEWGEWRGAS